MYLGLRNARDFPLVLRGAAIARTQRVKIQPRRTSVGGDLIEIGGSNRLLRSTTSFRRTGNFALLNASRYRSIDRLVDPSAQVRLVVRAAPLRARAVTFIAIHVSPRDGNRGCPASRRVRRLIDERLFSNVTVARAGHSHG